MKKNSSLLFKIIFLTLFLNSCMNQKPSDARLIKLFESFTESKFPKSGRIIEKDNLNGLNDGWEVAIAKVKDTVEYNSLLNELNKREFISKKIRENGIGYFSSKLAAEKTSLIDSIYFGKEWFVFGFIKNENIIIFEKDW